MMKITGSGTLYIDGKAVGELVDADLEIKPDATPRFEIEGVQTIPCHKCGKIPSGFSLAKALNEWAYIGNAFTCPDCAKKITGRDLP